MFRDYLLDSRVHALAAIPVVQQVVGSVTTIASLIGMVVSVAKLVFHGIQKLAAKNNPERLKELNAKIHEDKGGVALSLYYLVFGLLTVTPVVGSITNGVFAYIASRPVPQKQVQIQETAINDSISLEDSLDLEDNL